MLTQTQSSRPSRGSEARDRGSASVEAVIATPMLLLLVLAIIQAGLLVHAHHIAQAAAHTALDAARAELADGGTGTTAAEASLQRNASRALEDTGVSVWRGPETVTVTITGQTVRIVPLFDLPVEVTVTGAVEHIEPFEQDQ
ncbi:pilus assembly protein [Glycomyces sp. L485]|uniref:TadE family protein n=1 Tax=Glycomyces sp. L485 TaxID=2909235 RepID=UPI001F4A1AFF|nr:TadE family protein [Glycomyces sp. L485]MCH7229956.1 pilus assembly protein [Glycomyces sp. L485]